MFNHIFQNNLVLQIPSWLGQYAFAKHLLPVSNKQNLVKFYIVNEI